MSVWECVRSSLGKMWALRTQIRRPEAWDSEWQVDVCGMMVVMVDQTGLEFNYGRFMLGIH